MTLFRLALASWLLIVAGNTMQAQERARDLGVPFDGSTGPLNAITDVTGVEVGHTTLISGEGKLQQGKGPIRTGVTAILPRGKNDATPVFAGYFSQNGNGEMTGTAWIEESGFAEGPVLITNTHSVGVVRDATIKWQVAKRTQAQMFNDLWSLPIVAETWDGLFERHQRLSRNGRRCHSCAELGADRARCGRSSRRRHGHDLLWVQGRNRDLLA